MASKSNIAQDEIYRYVLDETGEVWVDLYENGQPKDVSGRTFHWDFVMRNTTGGGAAALQIVVSIPNALVLREPTRPCRVGLWLNPTDKAKLIDSSYRLWLSETTSGRKNPLVCYTFNWRIEPENFTPNAPLEPAVLVYDLLPPTNVPSVSTIYEGIRGTDAFVDVATPAGLKALAAPGPKLAYIAEREIVYVKIGARILALTGVDVTDTFD